jgi:4-hydroxy-4-methyl-2-oxoglutarate aldolase
MIDGFNTWSKGIDASFLQKMMLTSINAPIRIGHATVLPGDVVLAKSHGVLFIPAHLVEEVVTTSEVTQIRDEFGWQRLRSGTYTSGQIDSQWTEDIKKDFLEFVKNYHGELPMTEAEFERYMTERNW